MSRQKLTFDQIVYLVVALPTLFFASYIFAAMIGFIVFGYVYKRFKLEEFDRAFEISPLFGDGTVLTIVIAVLLLLPASLMTKRFFLAGWPTNNQNESALKARVDEVREKMD